MPIRSYLEDHSAFKPEQISALSEALETACTTLQIQPAHHRERKVVAERIIDLARGGVIDAMALSDRVVAETRALRSL